MRGLIAMVAGLAAAFGAPRETPAQAGSAKPILVLESHVGPRPEGIDRVMDMLQDQLETRGFAARPATILRLAGNGIARPGVLDPDLTAAVIAQRLNDGWAEFVAARWDEAITKLTQGLGEVERNPALVVNDTTNLDLTFKAYVALAVSHQRKADAGSAARWMIEAIRIFPSRPVSRTEAWGREGEKLYLDMYRQIQPMGRGRLSIAGGHPEAAIFVEGQLRGLGNAQLADLVPGAYRVFIRLPGTLGRQYRIQVAPNDEAFLHVDPDLDTILWAQDSSIALRFSSEGARRREGRYSVELSRRWTGSGEAAVLATSHDQGRSVLEGVRYRDGIELRRARIYTDVTDAGGPGKLAQFLADGTPGDGIEVLRTEAGPAPKEPRRRGDRVSQAVIGIGALAVIGSGAWYLASPDDDHSGPDYDDWKSPAVGAFVGGSIVVGAGVYLYLRNSRSTRAATAAMLGAGAAALLSGVMLYATDEEPYSGSGWVRKYYRDTAATGLIVGGAGFALTGVGIWLLRRDLRTPSVPVVLAERDRGFIGWSGRF
jgi:hypothetical protein